MVSKKNSTINIILNGKLFEYFSLRYEMRKECMISPFLFNIALEDLVSTKRQNTKKF